MPVNNVVPDTSIEADWGNDVADTVNAVEAALSVVETDVAALENLGIKGYAQITTSSATQTTLADVAGLSVTWTAVAGRAYRITVQYMLLSNTNTVYGNVWIRNGANTQLNVQTRYLNNTGYAEGGSIVHRLTGVSGSQTVKVSIDNATGGAHTVRLVGNALYPNFIMVEDIGPA